MTQATIVLPNESGQQHRLHLNAALEAITSDFAGSLAPATTYANMSWLDTSSTPSVLRRRDETNTSWTVSVPTKIASGASKVEATASGVLLDSGGDVDIKGSGGDSVLHYDNITEIVSFDKEVEFVGGTPSCSAAPTLAAHLTNKAFVEGLFSAGGNLPIQFKDEGSSLGTAGTVDTVNFTGEGLTATRAGSTVTVAATPSTGLNNILLNGEVTRVNQREVVNWGTVPIGSYGYDRWKKVDSENMVQIVEEYNYRPNTIYTLYGPNVVTQQITSPASGHWTIPEIPLTAYNVMLTEGTAIRPFEIRPIGYEREQCQRYFIRAGAGGSAYAVSTTAVGCQVTFPREMRVPPITTLIGGSGVNLILRMGGGLETVDIYASIQPTGNRGCLLYGTGTGYTVGGYYVMNNFCNCDAEL